MVTDDIAYAEVFEILSYMKKETVMKIPLEVLEYIRNNRNTKYISRIDPNNIFNKENISYETRTILAWIDLKYWASEESKKEKLKIYKENERKYQEKLKEKYSSNDIFNNSSDSTSIKNLEENLNMVEYKECKWYKKIFLKILGILRK